MKPAEVLAELAALGQEQTKRIFINHGAPEPLFGVKVEQLKTLQRRIKKDHTLSLELFASRNADAQYLAGLIADEHLLSADDLDRWARTATWHSISESIVAAVAAESAHGWMLARKWLGSADPQLESTGWATVSHLLSLLPTEALDLGWLEQLLQRVAASLHQSANRVRYTMNGFVIACGCYVPALTQSALSTAKAVGKVEVLLGKTACKVPDAEAYIRKCIEKSVLGKKKKAARC